MRSITKQVLRKTAFVNLQITRSFCKGIILPAQTDPYLLFLTGLYERPVQRVVAQKSAIGMIALNCGAHVGFFTLLLAKRVGKKGRVFAFEPDPTLRSILQRNIQLNSLNNVTVLPYAVSDRTGTVPFIAEGKSTSRMPGMGRRDDEGPLTTVESITVDDFCARNNVTPDLIKMDIEGAEGLALAGAKKVLTTARPVIICEIHTLKAAQQVHSILTECGYSKLSLITKTGRKKPWRLQANVAFTYHILAEP